MRSIRIHGLLLGAPRRHLLVTLRYGNALISVLTAVSSQFGAVATFAPLQQVAPATDVTLPSMQVPHIALVALFHKKRREKKTVP